MIGIYKITSPTNKIYIGSSIDIENRIKYYKSLDCKGQKRLYASLKKYGFSNHFFEILEECNIEELHTKESLYGIAFNVLGINGLNCVLPKTNSNFTHVSEETRKRMSEAKTGSKNTFFGKTHSEETKQKIRNFQTGRKHTFEHRKKVSLNNAKNKAKIVVDLNTGVFYSSAKEVSDLYKINHSTLRSALNGTNKNNTSFIYC
jgi:group I intron endonuclease